MSTRPEEDRKRSRIKLASEAVVVLITTVVTLGLKENNSIDRIPFDKPTRPRTLRRSESTSASSWLSNAIGKVKTAANSDSVEVGVEVSELVIVEVCVVVTVDVGVVVADVELVGSSAQNESKPAFSKPF